jgi:hypothetical protein
MAGPFEDEAVKGAVAAAIPAAAVPAMKSRRLILVVIRRV